jgi:hypothetical protein
MSKVEMEAKLTRIIETAPNASDQIAAIKSLTALRNAGKTGQGVPDPAFLVEYLRQAQEQGKDAVQLAQEAKEEAAGAIPNLDSPPEGNMAAEGSLENIAEVTQQQ